VTRYQSTSSKLSWYVRFSLLADRTAAMAVGTILSSAHLVVTMCIVALRISVGR